MRADTPDTAMTFLYFGYGSNTLTERLRARCPNTKCISVVEAAGYALDLSKPSKKAAEALGKAGVDDHRRLPAPQPLVRLPGESCP